MVACHLPRLVRSPGSTLSMIVVAPSLQSIRSRSLLLLLGARRRLTLLPLSSRTHVLDAPYLNYFYFNGQGCLDHRVPSSHVCRRMMYLKPLEVTCPSLTLRCTSLCKGSSHNACLCNDGSHITNSLQEGLLIEGQWWLVVAPSTAFESSSSICHLNMSNGKLRFLFLSN